MKNKHILTTHKWGFVATLELCEHHNWTFHGSFPREEKEITFDFIVARNVYEAVASGYAYHKLGAECWLNENFLPNPFPDGGNDWGRNISWWPTLNVTKNETKLYYRLNNLCEVLVSLPVSVGLQMYAEFAYNKWYKDAHTFLLRHLDVPIKCLNNITSTKGRRLNKKSHSSHEHTMLRMNHIDLITKFDDTIFNGLYRQLQSLVKCEL